MCPALKVKKLKFWRARLGGGEIPLWNFQFVLGLVYFLISTYSEILIHLAPNVKNFGGPD